jgi:hypothetical protein
MNVPPPKWIIGTAAPGTEDEAPEWLFHTTAPVFVCRVVDEETEGVPLSGFVYADAGWALCDFVFYGEAPVGKELRRWCRRAIKQL